MRKLRSILHASQLLTPTGDIRLLTENEMIITANLMMAKNTASKILDNLMSAKIIKSRLANVAGSVFDDDLIAFAAIFCNTPGKAVLYAHGLAHMWHLKGEEESCSLDDFTLKYVSSGVPTENFLHALWDEQKEHSAPLGNLLDTAEAWKAENFLPLNVN